MDSEEDGQESMQSVKECLRQKSWLYWPIVVLLVFPYLSTTAFGWLARHYGNSWSILSFERDTLTIEQCWWVFYSLFIYVVFWSVYFFSGWLSRWKRLPGQKLTLRQFLRKESLFYLRTNPHAKAVADDLTSKARTTIQVASILIAAMALFLNLRKNNLQFNWDNFPNFLNTLFIVFLALAGLFLLMSTDALDTSMNSFKRRFALSKQRYYKLGNTYYQLGVVSLLSGALCMIAAYKIRIVGLAVALFVSLGYPYWFHYPAGDGSDDSNYRCTQCLAWLIGVIYFLVSVGLSRPEWPVVGYASLIVGSVGWGLRLCRC